MSLKQWADNGWLREHRSSAKEIAGLLSIVNRDLKDAGRVEVSADWRFGIAYNAALKLCTIRPIRISRGHCRLRSCAWTSEDVFLWRLEG